MKPLWSSRQVDSKGRLTLGKSFANRTVIVEERDDVVLIRLGRVIPERECWLYENDAALEAVRQGLDQARRGELVDGPDLDAAAAIADQIPDD